MKSIRLRVALAVLAAYAALERETALAAGLPPDSPDDGPESSYSSILARELVAVVQPYAAPVPPFRPRHRSAGHNWWAAQMANGNGRDAAWMVAATEAARAQEA
jgi:hypothetical protein